MFWAVVGIFVVFYLRDAKKKTPDPLWIKGSENRMDISQ